MSFTRRFVPLATAAFLCLPFSVGCSAGPSGPSTRQIDVLSLEVEGAVYEDSKGGWDAGQKVKMLLSNTGAAVTATVAVTLSCNEGRWQKESSAELDGSERRYVYVDFPEPSWTAKDCIVGSSRVASVE